MNQYLLPPIEREWSSLLENWDWLLPDSFGAWLVNRFGDLFLVLDDGAVALLDINAGTLTRIAEHQDDFFEKLQVGDNAKIWLYLPLVDALIAAGINSDSAEMVYAFNKPILLGGSFTPDNVRITDYTEHLAFTGDLAEQLHEVPDGAEIGLKVRGDEFAGCGKTNCCSSSGNVKSSCESQAPHADHAHPHSERCRDAEGQHYAGCNGHGGCGGKGDCGHDHH
jgi:hypothetical protein